MIFKIYKVLAWLGCLIYGPWSRFYRMLFERKYKTLPIDRPWTPTQVLDFFKQCKWVPDKWYQFGDVISKPEKFYVTHLGDCDEHAVFAGTVMADRTPVWMLSVQWYNPNGNPYFAGHNVCVYQGIGGLCRISNDGRYGPFKSEEELALSVVPKNGILANYAFRSVKDLKWMGKKIR